MKKSPLLSLTHSQWESLCDGCGRCCLVKLEDESNGQVHYTNVACQYLNLDTCRCNHYENRTEVYPECMVLTKETLEDLEFMPSTCAYKLKHLGKNPIEDVDALKVSGRVVSEEYIHPRQIEDHIVEWIKVED